MGKFVQYCFMAISGFAVAQTNPLQAQQVVSIPASADAVLHQDFSGPNPGSFGGSTANGSGDYLFAGRTGFKNDYWLLRSAIKFDVAAVIPSAATIQSAELTLNMSRSIIAPEGDVFLHRITTNWSEGLSDAPGQEGAGTQAQPGDVTWVHTSFDTGFWNTLGGDFVANPSASTTVGNSENLGVYAWSSQGMVDDVTFWLANPSMNFGWMLVGDETGPQSETAKRYDSRSNSFTSQVPELTITYIEPVQGDQSEVWLFF